MSFTNYYFELGFNTALEKYAAKKEKEEGMGTAAKLGLGALGAGALGAGAYFSPEILSSLGAGDAAQWAGENIQAPMQAAGEAVADKATNAYDYLKSRGVSGVMDAAKNSIRSAMSTPEQVEALRAGRAQEVQKFIADQAAEHGVPGSFGNTMSDWGSDWGNNISDAASSAGNTISDTASAVGNRIGNTASDLGSSAARNAGELLDNAGSTLNNLDTPGNYAHRAADYIRGLAR